LLGLKEGQEAMSLGKSIDEVLADAEQIVRVWSENPTLALGAITQAGLQTKITALRAKRAEKDAVETQRTRLVNETNALAAELKDITIRSRAGIKAVYGPDSSQYEQSGGKRKSEHKKPSTKKKSEPNP
jgi:hypothetical protein